MTAATVTDDERLARVALSRVAEPGDERVGRLVMQTSAHSVWTALRGNDLQVRGVGGYRMRLPDADPAVDLERASRAGIRVIVPGDEEWPPALDAFEAKRPLLLWVRGEHDLRELTGQAVAVVGARAATDYGSYVAAELGASMAERRWCVVSGGAYGIDGKAHRGAIVAGGHTVAVLACGLDQAYPRGHETLFDQIAESGLLVGELPPGCAPTRYRFLERNRVIAGLSGGVVVVEAALRSGASNTARWADQLGRPVMAVPGPVTSQMSAGCHRLLRSEGAICVTNADEVLEAVGRIGADLAPRRAGAVDPRDSLGPVTSKVLETFSARGEHTADELGRKAGIEPQRVLRALSTLTSAHWVERTSAGWQLADHARRGRDTRTGGA